MDYARSTMEGSYLSGNKIIATGFVACWGRWRVGSGPTVFSRILFEIVALAFLQYLNESVHLQKKFSSTVFRDH